MYNTVYLLPNFDKFIRIIHIIPFTVLLAELCSASIDDNDTQCCLCDIHGILLNSYLNIYPDVERRV